MRFKKEIKIRVLRRSNSTSDDELLVFLQEPVKDFWSRFFCWHKWVYWKFSNATRQHRVCKKCYKKQTNSCVLNTHNEWVKDPVSVPQPKNLK